MGKLPVIAAPLHSRAKVSIPRLIAPVLVALAAPSAITGAAWSEPPTLSAGQRINATDAASYDVFGYGLALEGQVMLVGARGVDTPQVNAGAVYAFRIVNGVWQQTQKLVFPGANRDDQIGSALALSGNAAVAGAPGRGSSGAAFMLRFDGGTWFSQAEVGDPLLEPGAGFGSAVACTPTITAIGAPNAAAGTGLGAGKVRIFDRPAQVWQSGQLLEAPYPDAGDRFGSALAMSGEILLVAAPGDDDRGINAGAVYVYKRQAGEFMIVSKIYAPTPEAESCFGRSVSVNAGMLVVGAYKSDLAAPDGGAAFVFDMSQGGEVEHTRTLLPPGTASTAEFGNDVHTDGTSVVVGAPGYSLGGSLHGAAWVYLDEDHLADAVMRPYSESTLELCGARVRISAEAVMAASPAAPVGFAQSAGAVLLFDRTLDCNKNSTPDAIEIALGFLTDGNGDGVPDQCQCIADLTGDGAVNGIDLGLLIAFWGPAQPAFPQIDIDRDGFINGVDVGVLLGSWGSCE